MSERIFMFQIVTTELFSTNDKCIKKPIDLCVAAMIVLPVQDFQPKDKCGLLDRVSTSCKPTYNVPGHKHV